MNKLQIYARFDEKNVFLSSQKILKKFNKNYINFNICETTVRRL